MARPRSDIRPRLLDAARARFLQEGVDGASLRAIAADAGTSIGMVYYYFPTKDDLFLAVIEEPYAALVADIATALAPDTPVADRLRRLYRRLGAMTEQESVTARIILREMMVSNDRLGRVIARFSRGHIPVVLGTLRDGMTDGTITTGLPPILLVLVTFAVGAAPQLLVSRAGALQPFADLPRGPVLGDALVHVLLHGIGGPAIAQDVSSRSAPAASARASTPRRRPRSSRNPRSPRGGRTR